MLLKSFATKVNRLFRFGNWWHYKIPLLIGIFFGLQEISRGESATRILWKILILVVWMIASASFGYFVNDWSDIEEDRLAGKENTVSNLSLPNRWILVTFLFLFTLSIQHLLNGLCSIAFLLSCIHLLLFFLYSVPPIRLKQYLLPGIICDSLYAHVLPAAIIFASVNWGQHSYWHEFIVLCVWQWVMGTKNILLHHIFDGKNDARSNHPNTANTYKPLCVLKFTNGLLLPVELLTGLLFMLMVSAPLALIALLLILFRLFLVRIVWQNRNLLLNKKLAYLISNGVYEGYIPLLTILFLFHGKPWIWGTLSFFYLLIFPKFTRSVVNDTQSLFYYLKPKG